MIFTRANLISVISFRRYRTYCQTLKLLYTIKCADSLPIAGNCGRGKVVGLIVIQVSLKDLSAVIDVVFLVL